ncbi:Adhesion G protein-coupled receptor A3 [Bagarius yarrelli]|uniref:Adhesion G protein-coupled receptor A3 n=1 Tax=Bagarius yarrelli TaxID=175774 RepID=A0A556TMP6_BAGYA|nr:Adhesion G protein-coupled receptor A3 [Bagarius yarrelli]
MRVVSVFFALAALWKLSVASRRHCPDLTVESCECGAERSGALNRRSARVTVACNDADLTDTLEPRALLTTTTTLVQDNPVPGLAATSSWHPSWLSTQRVVPVFKRRLKIMCRFAGWGLKALRTLGAGHSLPPSGGPHVGWGCCTPWSGPLHPSPLPLEDGPQISHPGIGAWSILSNNKISTVKNGSFFGLHLLERLDLRSNLISTVEPGAFRGLFMLKRLDLSNNRIGCLSAEIFLDLGNLSKLNLSGNIFSTLPEGLFMYLISLRVLWSGCCCGQKPEMYEWEMRPHVFILYTFMAFQFVVSKNSRLTVRQLVFRGDRFPLQCTASYLDPSVTLSWSHNHWPVHTQEEKGVYVEDSIIHDCCLITSELILSNVDADVSGNWQCHVTSSRGNSSIGMEIVVLETSALYCSAERVTGNKGDFRWPKTQAGLMAFLPCATTSYSSNDKRAWRRCDKQGRWAEDDYNQCPYSSKFTRMLQELTQIPLNSSNALLLAQQLSSITSDAAMFVDMMDVIFVTHLVEKITRHVDRLQELGDYVSDIASNMMQVEEHILWMAQNEARACTRIVQCVERIADLTFNTHSQNISKVSPNIALVSFVLRPSSLMGLFCTVLANLDQNPGSGVSLLNFRCNTSNVTGLPSGQLSQNAVAVASIHLPLAGSLRASALRSVDNSTCRLQLIVFRNGKLFPCTGNSSSLADDGKRKSVATPVAFIKLDGCSLDSSIQPVIITLRHLAVGADPTAAYWDFDLLDGHGGWRAEGCYITGSTGNATTIHCTQHKNFAVLMDLKKVLSFPPYPGDFLHPVVYACTAVMLLCLFASIITYIVHHSAIRISRKGWHMLLNFCFHTALTFAVFAGGINRIKYPIFCQAVGVILHYSSLSTMLWLGFTARNIYKQVSKKPPKTQDGDVPPHPPKSPMLRFYLVGGGIPFIICGITAAINIENYGSGEQTPYCWMAWEPSLGAFYGPVAFIVLVTCVYFLCTFIQLRKHPERKYELKVLSEEQQRLAVADVPHCHHQGEPGMTEGDGSRCHAGCPGLINPSLLANEHSFKAQLRSAAFTLFLFLATWIFGALAVSQAHFLDMIFSCLYGAFSVTLGLFVLIHHCAKRDDVWHCWCTCCPGHQANTSQGHGHAHGRPKVNVNGDVHRHGHGHDHCHLDSPCTGKSILTHTHSHGLCKLSNLQAQNHVTCLTPVSPVTPCCSALQTEKLLEDRPIHLHSCLKPSRTKGRHRASPAGDRELAFHLPASADAGSGHSSPTDSPHSTCQRQGHICHLHEHHEWHHACTHDAPMCHAALCHRHSCCSKAESLPSPRCNTESRETGALLCSCGKITEDELAVLCHGHIEMHPRRQSFPQCVPNQNGLLKGSGLEGHLYQSDSTGNIRTGPWKNETTV